MAGGAAFVPTCRMDATMKRTPLSALLITLLVLPPASLQAAGSTSCDSGNPANWLSAVQMTERLNADGWIVDDVVSANGCWKITGEDPAGKRVTGYFHPLSARQLQVTSGG